MRTRVLLMLAMESGLILKKKRLLERVKARVSFAVSEEKTMILSSVKSSASATAASREV